MSCLSWSFSMTTLMRIFTEMLNNKIFHADMLFGPLHGSWFMLQDLLSSFCSYHYRQS